MMSYVSLIRKMEEARRVKETATEVCHIAIVSEATSVSFVSPSPGHFSPVGEPKAYGPGKPSPENAKKPIEVRRRPARQFLDELNRLYNTRAAILQTLAGLAREEAERRALSEVKASDIYQRCRALGLKAWCSGTNWVMKFDEADLNAIADAVIARQKTASQPPQLYDVATAARLLSLPERWLYERTAKGAIPFHRYGKYIRFDESDLRQIIAMGNGNSGNQPEDDN
jgi:excisionase family DNA binding protein